MKQLYFAQAYGECAYSSGAYQANPACTSTTGTNPGTNGTPNNGNNVLANTGFAVAVIAALAAFLIFVALVVRFWHGKKAGKNTNEPPTINPSPGSGTPS